jgi:hypothetical protein
VVDAPGVLSGTSTQDPQRLIAEFKEENMKAFFKNLLGQTIAVVISTLLVGGLVYLMI